MARLPHIEDILNNMPIPKQQKSRCYWQILKENGYSKKDGEIIWDSDKIKGFKLYQSMDKIEIMITV